MISRSGRDWLRVGAALVCFCFVFLLLAQSSFDLERDPDAGSQLSKGFLILHGKHPFVEIDSSVYGPAIFYLSALAQKLDGQRLISEVAVIGVGYLLAYALLFWTFLRRSRHRILYWLFVAACLLTLPRFHKYHVVLAPAIYLACLHCAARRDTPVGTGIWLGVGSALAGVFRLDFGAYCIASSVVLIWLRSRDDTLGHWPRAYGALICSGGLIVAPWLVFLLTSVEPVRLLTRITDTTIGVYSGLSSPLPLFEDSGSPLSDSNRFVIAYWLLKAIPFIGVGLLALGYFHETRTSRSKAASDEGAAFFVAASIAAGLFFLQASHRVDASHIRQVLPPVAFVALLLADRLLSSGGRRRIGLTFAGTLVVFVCFAASTFVTPGIVASDSYSASRIKSVMRSWTLTKSEIVGRRGNPDTDALNNAIRRVQDLTRPQDPVLFLPYSAQTYYFSGRIFETPFGWLNPGRFLRGQSEAAFIEAMARTEFIVDEPAFSFDGLAARNMRSYAARLSTFIYETYGIFEVSGPYLLLSNSRTVLESEGRYALDLVLASDAQTTVLDAPEARTTAEPDNCVTVRSVNTLAARPHGRPHRMPPGAGLLLDLVDCNTAASTRDDCEVVAIRGRGATYLVTDRAGKPRNGSEIGKNDLIDTRGVVPGLYEVATFTRPGCAGDERGATTPIRTGSTGVSITFEPQNGLGPTAAAVGSEVYQ